MDEQTGCLTSASRWSTLTLAFFVVTLLPITILIYNFVATFFSPEVLSNVVIENLIQSGMIHREVAVNLLSPDLLGSEGSQDFSFEEAFGHLTDAERIEIVETIAPESWLEVQVREVVSALDRWLEGDEVWPRIALDHGPIKESLLQGGAARIVEVVVDSWPSCSPQQVSQMQNRDVLTGEMPVLYCEPPEPIRTRMSNFLVVQIEQLARDLPDRVPLLTDQGNEANPDQPARLKERLRSLRAFGFSAWMLPFALLGLTVSLAVRSWKDLTRWWGRLFLIAGIITLVAGLLLAAVVERAIPAVFSQLRAQAGFVFNILVIAARALSDVVLGSTAGHAVLLIFAGALLLFGYWLIQRRDRPTSAASPGGNSSSGGAGSDAEVARPADTPPPVPPYERV